MNDEYDKTIHGTQDERLLETPHADEFLHTDTWRVFRIMGEFVQGFEDLARIKNGVAIFGSARTPPDDPEYKAAQETAALLAHAGCSVITGGGPGIMEAANRGAHDAGGKTIGLNIGLPFEQRPNPYITPELSFEFHYFFMRKFWFAYLAKGLVIFPGGFGTLDELSEILTLVQTKKLNKKIITVLYGSEFWKEILNFDALVKHGVISESDLSLFEYADTPERAFEVLRDGLTEHYLKPEKPFSGPTKGDQAPSIAKTRI